jgi:hypothetical protein
MSDALVFAFGTDGTGLTSFGRSALTAAFVDAPGGTQDTTTARIPANSNKQRLEIAADAGHNSGVFTRVFVFDHDNTSSAFPLRLFTTNNADTGNGYATGALAGYIYSDGYIALNRENQAGIIEGPASTTGIVVGGRNTLVVTRRADNTIAMSANGGAVLTGVASDYTFGTFAFGSSDTRDHDNSALILHWYAQSPSASSDAQLIDLSNNPTMMTRTVGSGAPDTTPPTFVSATSDAYGENVTVQFSEGLTVTDIVDASFTVPGHTITAATVAGAAVTLGMNPPIAVAEAFTVAYDGTGGVKDVAGNLAAAFTAQTGTNNTTMSRPSLQGYTLKTFGDQSFTDFKTEADLQTWLNTHNPPAEGKPTMIWLYKDIQLGGRQWGPTYSDDNLYVTMRPAPGLSFDDLEPDTAPGAYGTQGLVANVDSGRGSIRVGLVLEALRVRVTTEDINGGMNFRRDGWGHGGNVIGMNGCRVYATTLNRPLDVGEYGSAVVFRDCLIIHDHPTSTAPICNDGGSSSADRCTFVRRGNVGSTTSALGGYDSVTNCVFSQCGPNAMGNPSTATNNFTDVAQNAGVTGITLVSGSMFQDFNTNFRPATNSALVGGASASAISTNDNNGNNRGTAPDAGAFQLTPAMPLAKGQVVSQNIDGQTLTVNINTTGTVSSGKITLSPANTTSGAQSVGPLDLTLGSGTASSVIHDIEPGDYTITATLTNAGGTNLVQGTTPFTIRGVGGGVVDPGTVDPATAWVWTLFASDATVGTPVTLRVAPNGAVSGSYTITFTDNGGGGTFSQAAVSSVNGEPVTVTYTPNSAGTKSLSFSTNSPLPSPAARQMNVTTAALPAPTIAVATADNVIMQGTTASINGTCNLRGDVAGKVEMFIDPQPSGASVGPINVNETDTAWNVIRNNVGAGSYRFRFVATANGQTATAQTGVINVLGLTGAVAIPF